MKLYHTDKKTTSWQLDWWKLCQLLKEQTEWKTFFHKIPEVPRPLHLNCNLQVTSLKIISSKALKHCITFPSYKYINRCIYMHLPIQYTDKVSQEMRWNRCIKNTVNSLYPGKTHNYKEYSCWNLWTWNEILHDS